MVPTILISLANKMFTCFSLLFFLYSIAPFNQIHFNCKLDFKISLLAITAAFNDYLFHFLQHAISSALHDLDKLHSLQHAICSQVVNFQQFVMIFSPLFSILHSGSMKHDMTSQPPHH